MVAAAIGAAFLFDHVTNIVPRSADKKMIGIYAARSITSMADTCASRDWSSKFFKCHAMGSILFSPNTENAVSIAVAVAFPEPTAPNADALGCEESLF